VEVSVCACLCCQVVELATGGPLCKQRLLLGVPACPRKEKNRIIKLFELEGTLKGHVVQLPCNEWGHAQLDQDAQGLKER